MIFTPSPALAKVIYKAAYGIRDASYRSPEELVQLITDAITAHLADPAHANDARAWAEATMDEVAVQWADEAPRNYTPWYRVGETP